MFIFDMIRKQKFENEQKLIMFDQISRNAATCVKKKNLPFRPEHGMNFQNEKTWKKWKSSFDSLVSFFYGVYSANLVRNDFFPILEIWSDMKVQFLHCTSGEKSLFPISQIWAKF